MRLPERLKQGDKVAVVSTARKVSAAEMQPAISVLTSWGLQVIFGKTIGAGEFQFAGSDELRMTDLQAMLDDDSIKAVIFARGGYGTTRIIDDIDWRKFLKNPKWLCGFSDITVIHSHLLSVYHVPSVHSILGISFSSASDESKDSLRKFLFEGILKYEIQSHPYNRAGAATGILCGGNLSMLYSLAATPSDIDAAGKILLIEDIDEHLYHIDRMVLNLKRSGKLENLAGLVVGHFTDMKNKDDQNPFGKSAYEIIADHISEYSYPVCFSFPAGHESDNRTLVMGMPWKLKVKDAVELMLI